MINPQPILQVDSLSKRYRRRGLFFGGEGSEVVAVDGVSLTVEIGTTLGIVGESGSGKTTLGRMIVGLIKPSEGSIRLDGKDIAEMTAAVLHSRAQYVFQDPYSALNPRLTIGQSIEVPLRYIARLARAERSFRLRELMALTGLRPELAGRYPHELSGGQRQRVVIARALAVKPALLVLDEPVSSLDVSIQAQILALLRDVQRELGLTSLFISHDLAVVESLCDQVVVMLGGRVVERGTRDEIFNRPDHPYTRKLLAAVPGGSIGKGPAHAAGAR